MVVTHTHTHTHSLTHSLPLWRTLGIPEDLRGSALCGPFALSGAPSFPEIDRCRCPRPPSLSPTSHSFGTLSASAVSLPQGLKGCEMGEVCGGGFSFLTHPISGITNPHPSASRPAAERLLIASVHPGKNGFPGQVSGRSGGGQSAAQRPPAHSQCLCLCPLYRRLPPFW